jgi:hypothetical protein
MNTDTPKTISEVTDELERIQQDLFRLQKTLEKIEGLRLPQAKRGDREGRMSVSDANP